LISARTFPSPSFDRSESDGLIPNGAGGGEGETTFGLDNAAGLGGALAAGGLAAAMPGGGAVEGL